MPFGNRKGRGLSRKSNVTKRKRDSRLRGDERNFMDLTPSQDEPASQAQPEDPSTHEDSGAGVDQATSSPFNGFPSENGPPVNDESGRTHFN